MRALTMKPVLVAAGLAAALVGLAACADEDYGGPRRVTYVHRPIGYDGFYDGYYGPVYDGYWADDGFYYATGEGRPYLRDEAGHFRREGADGYREYHGGRYRPRDPR